MNLKKKYFLTPIIIAFVTIMAIFTLLEERKHLRGEGTPPLNQKDNIKIRIAAYAHEFKHCNLTPIHGPQFDTKKIGPLTILWPYEIDSFLTVPENIKNRYNFTNASLSHWPKGKTNLTIALNYTSKTQISLNPENIMEVLEAEDLFKEIQNTTGIKLSMAKDPIVYGNDYRTFSDAADIILRPTTRTPYNPCSIVQDKEKITFIPVLYTAEPFIESSVRMLHLINEQGIKKAICEPLSPHKHDNLAHRFKQCILIALVPNLTNIDEAKYFDYLEYYYP